MAKASKTAAERWALPASQARSRATRERLLASAERVFADKGYDGTRLTDIAEDAGCSVGTVYFRFKDKDALFLAVAQSFAEEARGGLGRMHEALSGRDGDTIIRIFVTAVATRLSEHKGLFRAIVERGFDRDDAMKQIFGFRDELAAALEKVLNTRRNSLRVRVMTQMVYGFLLAGVLNRQAPTRIDDARVVGELAKACIAYFNAGSDA
ncbi:MAG TPA: TetR/AcrR family transcriptional regulator [Rhizomicrobium sp.]|jgi:AcrR family transcriptional regulator